MKHKIYLFLKILLLWFFLHSLFIVIDGLRDEVGSCDVVVILGNKVHKNGQLSDRLKARVNKGLEWYQNGRCQKILVSGGLGKEGQYEGDAMAAYLVNQGVPLTAIIIDNKGDNTNATALNALALFSDQTSITISANIITLVELGWPSKRLVLQVFMGFMRIILNCEISTLSFENSLATINIGGCNFF